MQDHTAGKWQKQNLKPKELLVKSVRLTTVLSFSYGGLRKKGVRDGEKCFWSEGQKNNWFKSNEVGCWPLCLCFFFKSQDSEIILSVHFPAENKLYRKVPSLILNMQFGQRDMHVYHHGRKHFIAFETTWKLVMPNLTASSKCSQFGIPLPLTTYIF